jgi:hypothetical protein
VNYFQQFNELSANAKNRQIDQMLDAIKQGFENSEKSGTGFRFEQKMREAEQNYLRQSSMDVLVTQPGSTFAGAKMFGDFVNAE